ncbi:MAG: transglutaminase family protein [Planctomyces sp.]|nr:transglutaminase family protein [Planctomyces sp.]
MDLISQFTEDAEFSKLLGFQSGVDLTCAALELARDCDPRLEFAPTLAALDDIAERLRPAVTRLRSDVDALRKMCDALAEEFDFGGDSACFERADSSYLNRVVETGRGIPISLSLVYVAVGERLGLPLSGVATPAHFLCRFDGLAGPLFVDAFRHGRVLDPAECIDWISDVSGLPVAAVRPSLEPAAPRTIITRMLNNLKALHLRQADWRAAESVLQRLLALRPGSFCDRRDLAAVSLMLERPGRVLDLFESFSNYASDEERESACEMLSAARQLIIAWN